MLQNTELERLTRDKHFSILGLLVSYEENEVLWIRTLELYLQHLIFFITYKAAQKDKVLPNTQLEKFAREKRFSLLGLFLIYEENEVLWIHTLELYLQHLIFFITYK